MTESGARDEKQMNWVYGVGIIQNEEQLEWGLRFQKFEFAEIEQTDYC